MPDSGPLAVGQWLGLAVADLDDLHQRQRGDRGCLRMFGPFGHAAHHAARTLGGEDRLFQFERVPFGHGLPHRLPLLGHAEHIHRGGAVVREIGVDIAPAAVLRRVDAHHRVPVGRNRRAVDLQVMAAAQRSDRLAQIDRNLLAAAAAQLPQIGGGEPGRGQCRGTRRTDAERGRQYRVGAAGDLDFAGTLLGPAGNRQDRAQGVVGHPRFSHTK